MRESFAKSLRVCRLEEGGNDDDPHDHGGRTSRGVTQREWDVDRRQAWMAGLAPLPDDVWAASDAAIDAIYGRRYWMPDCDAMPAGLDLVFFLFNVNAGHVQAARELQRVLGVAIDGILGESTRAAIANAPDVPILIRQYCDAQRAFYRHLAQFPRYGRGWLARVDHAQAAGQQLAGYAHLAAVVTAHGVAAAARVDAVKDQPAITVSAKANPADLAQPVVPPEKAVAAGGGAGACIGALQQLHDTLTPIAAYAHWAEIGLAGVAAGSVGLALYGLWKRQQTQAAVMGAAHV